MVMVRNENIKSAQIQVSQPFQKKIWILWIVDRFSKNLLHWYYQTYFKYKRYDWLGYGATEDVWQTVSNNKLCVLRECFVQHVGIQKQSIALFMFVIQQSIEYPNICFRMAPSAKGLESGFARTI